MDGRQWDSNPQEEKYVIFEIKPCCTQGYFSDIFYGIRNILISLYASKYKLTRNKNASHIFPRHFLTEAMIGVICLYMHSVLYICHTRSLGFKYLHYFRSYDNHCTKCTCASCAPTTRLFDAKTCF